MVVDIIYGKRQSNKDLFRTIGMKQVEVDTILDALREAKSLFEDGTVPSFIDIPDEVLHIKDLNFDWTDLKEFKKIRGILEYNGFDIFVIERTDLKIKPETIADAMGRYYTIKEMDEVWYQGVSALVKEESQLGYPFAIMESVNYIVKETDVPEGFINLEGERKTFEDLISTGLALDFDTKNLENFIKGTGWKTFIFLES